MIEITVQVVLLFLLSLVVSNKKSLAIFTEYVLYATPAFGIITVVINTYILIQIYKYHGFYPVKNFSDYLPWYFLNMDFNFALLPVFFGFIIILSVFTKELSVYKQSIYSGLLLLFTFHILLSNSRRGFILLTVIYIMLFLFTAISYFMTYKSLKTFRSNILFFISVFSVLTVAVIIFIFAGSYSFKVKTLQFIGINDVSSAKRIISSAVYGHFSRFKSDARYYELNKKLWSVTYDPRDPDNGWGYGIYKTISPLTGKNLEIVPAGSIGYFLDKTCSYGNSTTHCYSNTVIGEKKVTEKNIVESSVFCYVSENFNGDMVCLRADGQTYGNRVGEYDYKIKGIWQKLSIRANCRDGDAPVSLYFNKQGDTTLNNLNGYIIFAYPQYRIISKDSENIQSTSGNYMNDFHELLSLRPVSDVKNHDLSSLSAVTYTDTCDSCNTSVFTYSRPSELFSPNLAAINIIPRLFLKSLPDRSDKDAIRNLIRRLFTEESTFLTPVNSLVLKHDSLNMVDDRLLRWKFALQIFSKEFDWKQKIFGGGFSFLNWYGFYFLNDKTKTDYPHNPFLHILLYSGIMGLLIYIVFIYYALRYYIRYLDEYSIMFICFLITFFFTFFSGGNPFDPPVMGFLIIFPYFFNHIIKKDLDIRNKVNDYNG
jgi:hypothetical protein